MKSNDKDLLMDQVNKRKLQLMKKEILPKLLKKVLVSKLARHMNTLKLGLMTLKQDKRKQKLASALKLSKCLDAAKNKALHAVLFQIAKKSVLNATPESKLLIKGKEYSDLSMFDFSNIKISDFQSFNNNTLESIKKSVFEVINKPKLNKQKLDGAQILATFLEKKVMGLKIDFWLPMRTMGASTKSGVKKDRVL